MPRIEESIDIAAAASDVFRFCHDVANRPKWDEEVLGIEVLTPGPVRQGTLMRIDSKQAGGAAFSWDAEYVGFKFPSDSRLRVIDAASSSPFGRGSELKWEISSAAGGTHLNWVWDYQPNGFLARIFDLLGKRFSTQRSIKNSLSNLKTMIETGKRATSP